MFQNPIIREIAACFILVWFVVGFFVLFFFFLFSFLSLKKGFSLETSYWWKLLTDGNFLTWLSLPTEAARKCSSQHLFFIMHSHLKWELRHKIVQPVCLMWVTKFVGTVSKSMAPSGLNTRLFIRFSVLSPSFHEYIHQINLWEEGISLKSLLWNISKQGFHIHLILTRHLMPLQLEHTHL